ncbi:fused MFS/spermidine synthase [Caulobacter sp. 17J65-9]|uniref:spermidine synthase n=1 Tax=Caulobacter sp. 17J65-9 TaxID=2709382 RepID=UPI0013C6060A|nr:fused MFS/spermidine synthase [Caulobacter sp. 17J65-9]NEX93916.1 spermidine synthase [Caulobacter sp. 17J65-9]
MTEVVLDRPVARTAPVLFALAVFTSASLVFVVQPMVAKLILPKLGGSAAVWNTSMVFFQAALLAGYAYAHALQRVRSLRAQVGVHLAALALAALFLPLRVSGVLGDPPPDAPIVWLLGVLALSVGAPFAVLSATAPLLQAWYARVRAGEPDAANPYVLYAASNLGSFLALLAYPVLLEPLLRLQSQTAVWTGGYLVFVVMMLGLAALAWRSRDAAVADEPLTRSEPIAWKRRLVWLLMAAAPSSLMLGVTSYLSTDVASAPFLWVVPLALYLLTFVIAFQAKPLISPGIALLAHALIVPVCVSWLPFNTTLPTLLQFVVHLSAFFATALVCHQALAARRPPADRLTEFYLWLSLGGVVGGAFTALVAPVVFDVVREYPLVLVLAALARSRAAGPLGRRDWILLAAAVAVCSIAPAMLALLKAHPALARFYEWKTGVMLGHALLLVAAVCAILVRGRPVLFTVVLAVMSMSAQGLAGQFNWIESKRSFFGVLRIARYDDVRYGPVHVLMHGSTMHGAEIVDPKNRCVPMLYYATTTPIGQAMLKVQNHKPAAVVGVVGLGTGTLATYKRAADSLTYYEIDPLVERFARDPNRFGFISRCAEGPVGVVLGDARLSLAHEPADKFDLLVIDAFSSDSVPVHLLTEEALRGYLRVLKPDGVVLLHLSNRNLEITTPAIAAARAVGAPAMLSAFKAKDKRSPMIEASTEALIVARSEEGLRAFQGDSRWWVPPATETRAWTDDYTNLIGAMWRDMKADAEDARKRAALQSR